MIWVFVTDVTTAWWTIAPERKKTRTFARLDPKPWPVIVTAVPPVTGPLCGLEHTEMNGPFGRPLVVNWRISDFCAFLFARVTVPLTVTTPSMSEHTVAATAPLCVTSEIDWSPFWAKTPKLVERTTEVPSGTAEPFNVANA